MSRQAFTGTSASAGLDVGVLYRPDRAPTAAQDADNGGDPRERITDALNAVAARLEALAAVLRSGGRGEEADIMVATSLIATDVELRDLAVQHALSGVSVTAAVVQAADHYADILSTLDDPTLADRAADVRQIGRAAVRVLVGDQTTAPTDALVLTAHELGAAELLEHGDRVVAAASVTGGPNSHAAIVARSLGIPFVLGVAPGLLDEQDGSVVLVDGDRATVVVSPTPEELRSARAAIEAAAERRAGFAAERGLPCRTTDGHPIVLRANVATVHDADAALQAGAHGVGLLRTELPFLEATTCPTTRQHSEALGPVLRQLAGQPVTVRTLDFADDKLPPFLTDTAVDGRIGRWLPRMIEHPELFADQFRAILARGAQCQLQIMIPMIASADELAACRRMLLAAAAEVGVTPPPLGAMIELREAVEAADELTEAADFFSIGTNDLTAQLLGLDRRDPALTPALGAHPEVLRAIHRVVTSAHRRGVTVSVCGDAAAHPLVTPLLVGLDVDTLSVSPAAVDEVRWRIRRLDHGVCAGIARDALACATPDAVWQRVTDSNLTTVH